MNWAASNTEPQSSCQPLPAHERQRVYLLPGELHVSTQSAQISTILGSCVSICLWDSSTRSGGMNHFLLPFSRNFSPASSRFGDYSTAILLEKMLSAGCKKQYLTAKVFGGADMFHDLSNYSDSLGGRNVASALEMMKNTGIPVIAQETGGTKGRKIIFDTEDGTVWARSV